MSNLKAVASFSGGLDSTLAAAIVAEQGVEVKGIHVRTGFAAGGSNSEEVRRSAEEIGIEIKAVNVSESYLEIVKYPKHGYGSAVNPCLDCRVFMLRKMKEIMENSGAKFVVSGEVLGQRPMTQNSKDLLYHVEKEAGLEGLLLRPLSAKLLPVTEPEKKGWIDREKLYEISGRSRKKQLELAEKFGISEYLQPAGGCLLTDESFGARLEELLNYEGKDNVDLEDVKLLRYGRQFRLPGSAKAIVGRDEEENRNLKSFAEKRWKMEATNYPSPITLVDPGAGKSDLRIAARLTARYSGGRDEELVKVVGDLNSRRWKKRVVPYPKESKLIEEMRI